MSPGKAILSIPGMQPDIVDVDGIQVRVKSLPTSRRIRRHLRRGQYQNPEREMVKKFLKPGDQVLEMGASLGIVACFIGRQTSPGGRLVSVEPNIDLKPFYEKQLELNGYESTWINALCCPIWENELPSLTALKVYFPSENNLLGRAGPSAEGGRDIPWETAEAVCADCSLEPDAIVMDIEGAEEVWTKISPCFPPTVRVLIAEFHHQIYGTETAAKAVQAVIDEGFQLAAYQHNVIAFERK